MGILNFSLRSFLGDSGFAMAVVTVLLAVISLVYTVRRHGDDGDKKVIKLSKGVKLVLWIVTIVVFGLTIAFHVIDNQVTIPDLYNYDYRVAGIKIEALGLRCGELIEAYSESVEAGNVINTSIPYGKTVRKGSVVDLTISKGSKPKTVTDVGEIEIPENRIPMGQAGNAFTPTDTPAPTNTHTPSPTPTNTATPTPTYTPTPTNTPTPTYTPTPTPHVHTLVIDASKGEYCYDCGETIAEWEIGVDWTTIPLQAGERERVEIKEETKTVYYGVCYYWWQESDMQIHKYYKKPSGYSLGKTYKTSEVNSIGKRDTVYHGITVGYYNSGVEGKTNYKYNVEISDDYYPDENSVPDYYNTWKKETKVIKYYRLMRLVER